MSGAGKKLLGRAQIADMFSVTRRYFRESIEPLPGFPAPDISFTQKTVLWDEKKGTEHEFICDRCGLRQSSKTEPQESPF